MSIELTQEHAIVGKQVDNTQCVSAENLLIANRTGNEQHVSSEHVIVNNYPTNSIQLSQMFVVVGIGSAAQLTIKKAVIPLTDTGKFNFLVDGVVRATNISGGDTSSPIVVNPGLHTISEQAGDGTDLDDYDVFIGKAANPDGTITLSSSEKANVVITNTNKVIPVPEGVTQQNPWELWGILNPDIVQVLPIARRFDQLGPIELFRYSKIKQIDYRVLAFGTSIPYTIYFNDNTIYSDSITTISGKEGSYLIDTPKGTAGNVVRIIFGPTLFDFHRYYIRLKCSLAGRDTEQKWIRLPLGN